MIVVNRRKLNFWERLYLPVVIGGLKVTGRHLFRTLFGGKAVTMEYPEQRWAVPTGYRGAPYLVKDQDGDTKCVSCQLCEFVCPPKAIRITPPGPDGQKADRANAEKMPQEFEINMLRCIFCGYYEEACPEEAIVMSRDYELVFEDVEDAIFGKDRLLVPVSRLQERLEYLRAYKG